MQVRAFWPQKKNTPNACSLLNFLKYGYYDLAKPLCIARIALRLALLLSISARR